jgi:steroid delta-isomerase-like uncharacterized protein
MDPLPSIVRRYIAAYNAKDVEALLECLTEDVVFENLPGGSTTARVKGKAAFAELAWQSAGLFSERKQLVKACIAAGPRVAIKVDYRATAAVDLLSGWAAGQTIQLEGASFFTMRDGRIAELTDISSPAA